MTPAEFDVVRRWNPFYRYELIRGVLVVAPPAGNAEMDPNQELGYLLLGYQYDDPRGSVIDNTLPEQTIYSLENRRRADRAIWIGLGRKPDPRADIPAILVEFVSASRRDWLRDYQEKLGEYLAIGVLEYWVINRFARTMTVFKPGPEGPTTTVIHETQSYQTDLLPGFSLPLARLMARADYWPAKKRPPQHKPPAGGNP